jgi:hypothetical protein
MRRDAVTVSSILFTLAFLMQTPVMFDSARLTHQARFRDISGQSGPTIPGDKVVIPNHSAPLAITSLAVIAIGLVVTWAGYFKGARWTWFVMFTIVWVWALPVSVLPNFRPWGGLALTSPSAFASMIRDSVQAAPLSFIARAILKDALAFLLMALALVLPLKTFIPRRRDRPSASGRTGPGAPEGTPFPGV